MELRRTLNITLNYSNKVLKPNNFKLLYKPSKKNTISSKRLTKLNRMHNNKLFILSTPKGVLSNFELVKQREGGTLLYSIVL